MPGSSDTSSGGEISKDQPSTITVPSPPLPTVKKPEDTNPPQVSVDGDYSSSFQVAPTVSGRATDDKGIASVEYSTDGGVNWLPVTLQRPGSKFTRFEFRPKDLTDDNYQVVIRARDKFGNTGTAEFTLIIDSFPPQVGGSIITFGAQILNTKSERQIYTVAGLDQKITLSAVGGPVSIDLLAFNQDNQLLHTFSLVMFN